jgi:excisionase family DNA binding protein
MSGSTKKLTIQDIAQSENVSDDTVRRWINTGQLPAYTYPGSGKDPITRIDVQDFEQFKRLNRKPVIVDSKVRDFSGHRGR